MADKHERALLWTLALIQFVHVLDSLLVIPLGPQFMHDLNLSPAAFGALVSAYSLAAAASGLAGAFILDRFDRKKAICTFLAGLVVATFICGIASKFEILLLGRIIAGACGGLIQALLFTIVGDSFLDERRGVATGTVMSSYSVATVIGIPAALFLAGQESWSFPFLVLAFLGAAVIIVTLVFLPTLKGHFKFVARQSAPGFWKLIKQRNSRLAFAMIIASMFSGFTVLPYISTYLSMNLGLSHQDLATVYFAGGVATFTSARWIGHLTDRFGKRKLFMYLGFASCVPTFVLTHSKPMPLLVVLVMTTLFFLLIAGRGIPSLSLITACVGPGLRGRFLSLTSSLQQASSGLASLLTGLFLTRSTGGELGHYDIAGNVSVAFILISVAVASRLNTKHVAVMNSRASMTD